MAEIKHIEIPIDQISLMDINPRLITNENFEKLCSDIKDDPNFLIQRPPLINLIDQKYYCYAGTQRVKACRKLNYETIKCFVEEDVPERVQNERMLKDNLHRGIWDEDKFDDLGFEISELEEFGLEGFTGIFDDLGNNTFSKTATELNDNFSVTFVFNKKHEEALKKFIADNGKDSLVEAILKKSEEEI